ncbi:hypothetical protein JHW43_001622 [Diplocarpon mali]|nr:hypothetical protein JHW43_001622 [Diplocarpon mali]
MTQEQAGQIPIIDISGPLSELEVARQLVDAAALHGFAYVRNEGKDIPVEAIESMFQLNIAEKEQIGDFKEAMNIGEFVEGKAQQPLPVAFAHHEQELDKFQKHCHSLMLRILTLFAIGLEIDTSSGGSDWFASRHRGPGPSSCTLRLLHYPPIPAGTDYQPDVDIRAGAHSDYGSITLLFQRPGQPGLEIIPPCTQTQASSSEKNYSSSAPWKPVPVYPPGTEGDPSPPILVNIGDLLSHWTNNLLKSTVHRVVFPNQARQGEDRYSIAYFGHPLGATVLEPVPSERVKALAVANIGASTGVKAMTADEHLMSRLKATYLSMYRNENEEATAA